MCGAKYENCHNLSSCLNFFQCQAIKRPVNTTVSYVPFTVLIQATVTEQAGWLRQQTVIFHSSGGWEF